MSHPRNSYVQQSPGKAMLIIITAALLVALIAWVIRPSIKRVETHQSTTAPGFSIPLSQEPCNEAHRAPGCRETVLQRYICGKRPTCCEKEYTEECAKAVRVLFDKDYTNNDF